MADCVDKSSTLYRILKIRTEEPLNKGCTPWIQRNCSIVYTLLNIIVHVHVQGTCTMYIHSYCYECRRNYNQSEFLTDNNLLLHRLTCTLA